MKIRPQLIELEDIFDSPTLNQTALKMLILSLNAVQGNVTIANNAAGDIRRPLMGVNMAAFLNVSMRFIEAFLPVTTSHNAFDALSERRTVRIDPLARHGRCARIITSPLRCPAGRRGSTFPLCTDTLLRLRLIGRYRLLADVWPVPVEFRGRRRPVHRPGRLSRLGGAQRTARRRSIVLHAVRGRS